MAPIDWTSFDSTTQMNAREFETWCSLNPRPKLGLAKSPPPPPPPAPPRQPTPKLDEAFFAQLEDSFGRTVVKAIERERERTNGKLAELRLEVEVLRARLKVEAAAERSVNRAPRRRTGSRHAGNGVLPQH